MIWPKFMDGRLNYFIIGLFVSVAILAFAGMGLWLAGGAGGEAAARYTILFDEDVSGLTDGGPVRYLGVNVGQIVSMQLLANDGIRVQVDIEVKGATPVNTGTYASLAYQGITGVALINLASETGDHKPLTLSAGFEYPLIPLKNTGLYAVFADAPEISKSLSRTLNHINELLNQENRDALSGSLKNMESLTSALAARQNDIAALPVKLNKVLAEMQSTLKQLRTLLTELQPGLPPIIDNIHNTSENLARLTARMDGWLDNSEQDLELFAREGLGQVPAMISDTRNAVRELEKLLRELRDNPSSLLYKPQSEPMLIDPEAQ